MTLLFMDGFDHYGDDEYLMLSGAYLEINGGDHHLSTANPRTGTHSIYWWGGVDSYLRRGLGGEYWTVGLGFAVYLGSLPQDNDRMHLCDFRADNNVVMFAISLTSTGNIKARRGSTGSGVTIGETFDQPVVAHAWNHFEVKVFIHDTLGYYEVRMNGVTILQGSNVDTRHSFYATIAQVTFLGSGVANPGVRNDYLDDIYAWNYLGTENNDFIGDRRVRTIFPTGDTAQADWNPVGSGTGFGALDEVWPDTDTTYIEAGPLAASSYETSEFELPDVPVEVAAISGVQVYPFMRKTDAGAASVQISMLSGSDSSDGDVVPLTTAWTYWPQMHEVDPATGAAWTPAGLEAAQLRISRTA